MVLYVSSLSSHNLSLLTCREGSCDLGQEGSEDSPNPRLKKIKVQIGADTQTAPDGRKQTETERRRIRRSVLLVLCLLTSSTVMLS